MRSAVDEIDRLFGAMFIFRDDDDDDGGGGGDGASGSD